MPKAWRGAALQDGSSIGCQQAAPGNDSAQGFAHRVCFVEGVQRRIELPHVETFPGAACCQVTEPNTWQSGSPPGGGLCDNDMVSRLAFLSAAEAR